jgi:integrase
MEFTKTSVAALVLPAGKTEHFEWDDTLPGFGVRLRAAGSRRWCVQFRVAGRQRRESLGDIRRVSLEDARKIARQRFAKVELGVDPRAGQKPTVTLRKAVDTYLGIRKDMLRPATYRQASYHLLRLWAPLHDQSLAEITRADVAAALQILTKNHGRIAAARARGNLSTLFGWAQREGICEHNPVQNTNNPAEGIRARDRVLTDDEVCSIWRACLDNDFGKITQLLLVSGCRRQEIGQLRWDEINLNTGVMVIPGERTKNHRALELTLPPLALAILRSAKPAEGRVFVFGRGRDRGFSGWAWGKLVLDNAITNAHGKALAPWCLHDARRTFRSGLSRLGVRPDVAELCINHVKGGVEATYDRYRYQPEVARALRLWAAHIEQLLTGVKGDRVVALRA